MKWRRLLFLWLWNPETESINEFLTYEKPEEPTYRGKHDSLVIAVTQGDAPYLPLHFRSVFQFEGEIIFSVDRASEKEMRLIEWFQKRRRNVKIVKKTIELCENRAWSTFLFGVHYAHGERIFLTAPDLVFPATVFSSDLKLPARFQYIDADTHLTYAYWKFLTKFTKHYCMEVYPNSFPFHSFSWSSEENLNAEHKMPTYHSYDTPVLKHLRKTKNPQREYAQGFFRRKQHWPFWKILLHTILYREPHLLTGYLAGGKC